MANDNSNNIVPLKRATMNTLSKPLRGTGGTKQPRRATVVLKDAILMAAAAVGADGKGLDGLLGYLTNIARTDPKTFCQLLARVIPLHVQTEDTGPQYYPSISEVQEELRRRGIPVERIFIQ
jgi:hypothetical protein